MKKQVPDLEQFVKEYLDSKKDFIAIRWADPYNGRHSMVRFELQNRHLKKAREWDDVKERWDYFWPGMSAAKCVKLVKSYSWEQRTSDSFFCIYRMNHIDDLEEKILELIPEENRERV